MQAIESGTHKELNTADAAVCRATLYNALALGFRAPSQETAVGLSQEGIATVARAAATIDDQPALATTVLRLTTTECSLPVLVASYQRLFGHTARGIISLYETEYGDQALFQQPQEMGDLAGFYRAFGLRLNTTAHERLDHVSCECEFMLFLALKEVYALEQHDTAMLEETCKASRLFLRDHLGRFGPAFARKLGREDRDEFYGTLGDVCFAFLNYECARVGVTAGPVDLSLHPAADDHVPMGCGSGTECAAMPGACGPEEIGG